MLYKQDNSGKKIYWRKLHGGKFTEWNNFKSGGSNLAIEGENSYQFCGTSNGLPVKWRLRNERRNSILITCHFPHLGWCFWLVENLLHPIRSTIQIWVVTHYQHGLSVFVPQTPFRGDTRGWVAKCSLFSQANLAILKKQRKQTKQNTYIDICYICHVLP